MPRAADEVSPPVEGPVGVPSRGIAIGTFNAVVFGRMVHFRDGDAVMVSPVEYHEYTRLKLPIAWDDV